MRTIIAGTGNNFLYGGGLGSLVKSKKKKKVSETFRREKRR